MKRKLLILLIILLIPLFASFSEEVITNKEAEIESIQTFMETYKVKNTYSEHDTVKVIIYYYPLTKQARIIYEDEFEVFDYSDAVVSLKRCLEEFTKQIGCYHYGRYRDDEEHSFKRNNKNYTRVTSYVNLWK